MGSSRFILVELATLTGSSRLILVGLATLPGSSWLILVGLATLPGSSRLILVGLGNLRFLQVKTQVLTPTAPLHHNRTEQLKKLGKFNTT